MTIGFGVKWGGKAVNQTEMTKGENAGLTYNLDRRMTKYSWKQIGDQARYKNKYGDYGNLSTYICDAFIHKDNVFSCNNINLSYTFSQDWFKRATRLQSLSISTSLSDIFISLPLNGKEELVIRFLLILISQFHVHFKGWYYDEKNYICNGAEFDNGIKCLYGLVNRSTGNKYDG